MLAVDSVVQGTAELLVDGRGPADRSFSRTVIDSRRVEKGDLFFALRGERRDGHDFIAEALGRGAAGRGGEGGGEARKGVAFSHVSAAPSALQRRAASWRARHDIRVIGVTGSVGK